METKTNYTLTQQQKDFFHLFGFLHIPGLFSDEIALLQSKFDQYFIEYKDELIQWDKIGYSRKILFSFMERESDLINILTGDKIFGLMESLLGNNFVYINSDANVFEGDTYWHWDSFGTLNDVLQVKMALYLEPLTADSGALRFLPGSHHMGSEYHKRIVKDLLQSEGEILGLPRDKVPAFAVETNPGDALIFNFQCKHASCFQQDDRRLVCMNFIEKIDGDNKEKLKASAVMAKQALGLNSIYAPLFVNTLDASKRHHIQPIIDSGAYNNDKA